MASMWYREICTTRQETDVWPCWAEIRWLTFSISEQPKSGRGESSLTPVSILYRRWPIALVMLARPTAAVSVVPSVTVSGKNAISVTAGLNQSPVTQCPR